MLTSPRTHLRVTPSQVELKPLTTKTGVPVPPSLARETGAGLVVSGSDYVQGDSIYLPTRITDATAGQVLEALR